MSNKCNIKDSIDALNYGLDSFEKAYKFTGGNMTKALKFALSELKTEYPNMDFDTTTFTDHVSDIMKEGGLVPKSYKFGGASKSNKEDVELAKQLKQKEKEEKNAKLIKENYDKNVNKIVNKFTGLSEDQKKTVASELMNTVVENGMINDKDVLNAISEATGRPKMSAKILEASDNLSEANRQHEAIKQKITDAIKNEATTEELDKLADEKYKAEDAVKKAGLELSRLTPPYSFWFHDHIMAAQLNLMNGRSYWKNITGVPFDAAIRLIGSPISSIIGLGFQVFTKTNPLPFGRKGLGVIAAIKDKKIQRKAALARKYGSVEVEGDIPAHNFFDYVNKFRNAKESWTQDQKMKALRLWLQGMLNISPGVASKFLSTPDQAVYTAVYEAELNSIAATKKLKDGARTAFLMNPDEASALYAHEKAQDATFKREFKGKKSKAVMKLLAYDPRTAYQEMVSEGTNPIIAKAVTSILATLKVIAVPFVKTPAAMTRITTRYILPEIGLAKTLMFNLKEQKDANLKNRIIADAFGRYVGAVALRYVALNLSAIGAITGLFGDEDKRALDTEEQAKGGPAKINLSALWRGITGQGYYIKDSDKWVSLSYMGVTGMIMGTYAHMTSKMTKKEREELANQTPLDPSFYFSSPKAPIAVIKSAMENTFLSGTNTMFKLFTEEDEDRWGKFGINAFSVMMTGAYNSHLQEISKASEAYAKKQYDKDLGFQDNLLNQFGYKFFYGATGPGMKNKVFNLSKDEEGTLKKKRTLFFDNNLGVFLAGEFGFDMEMFKSDTESEAYKLSDAAHKVEGKERAVFFPTGIGPIQNIKVRKGGKTSSINVELTPEQHEFLMSKASMARMFFAAPVINSDEFKTSLPAAQAKTLQKAYKTGLLEAKKLMLDRYPEIKEQLSDKQVEEDETDDFVKEQIKVLEKYIPKKIND